MTGDFNEITDHREKEGEKSGLISPSCPSSRCLVTVVCWNFYLLGIRFLGLEKYQEGQLLDRDWIEQWVMKISMKSFLIHRLIILDFGDQIMSSPYGYSHKASEEKEEIQI